MLNSFNLEINIYITLIIVLIRTKSTQYTTNGSFGKTINKFQDCYIKETLGLLKEKIKNFKIRIRFYQIKPVHIYIYIYIYINIYTSKCVRVYMCDHLDSFFL